MKDLGVGVLGREGKERESDVRSYCVPGSLPRTGNPERNKVAPAFLVEKDMEIWKPVIMTQDN